MALLHTSIEDVADFSGILPFDSATSKFYAMPIPEREAIFEKMRKLVEENGLEDTIAIDIKHKHFPMPPGHVLCEKQFPDEQKSVMKPMSIDKFEDQPTPFAFKLVHGHWVPHEFVMDCPSAVEGLVKVSDHTAFLEKLAAFLKENDLDDVLGFHVLHREHLGGGGRGTVETPGDAEDELILQPYTQQKYQDMIGSPTEQVMWSWGSKRPSADICVGHWCLGCIHTCMGHCNGHLWPFVSNVV